MQFNGALVKVGDKTIAVAAVDPSFLSLPQPEKMAEMRRYASAFPHTPTLLLIEDDNGHAEYFGRPDLAAQLADVPLAYMTFKVYETKED